MPNIPYSTDYKHTRIFKKKSSKPYSKPEHAKLYNSRRWRGLRNLYYQRNPLCAQCNRNGITKAGDCVDHIKPISEGGDFYEWKNLNTLCNKCHSLKTAKEVNNRIKKKRDEQ